MIHLKDKLSRLTYRQACKLLGPHGDRLIMEGGKYDINIYEQILLEKDLFRLRMGKAQVSIDLDPEKNQRILARCSLCGNSCKHIGAAFSLILEEKLSLGLSAPPPETAPIESLSDAELISQAISERAERAQKEKMQLTALDKAQLWSDYLLTSQTSGKTYRVALRGWERGQSYCSCPDFRKNTLGTCKHILHALDKANKRFNKSVKKTPYRVKDICVYLKYGESLELRLLLPEKLASQAGKILGPFRDHRIEDIRDLVKRIGKIEQLGIPVTIYPDAEEYINHALYQDRVRERIEQIRKDPQHHPLRKTLLKTELLPYQLDGIAFAAGAGRAIIADDMGLGKTIQGIGVAELLSKDADISRVLIVCPASLKSQWRLEIKRFSDRSCQLVLGGAKDRAAQYDNGCFFTICNYEQVLRDVLAVEKVRWDLIILDEGQRIKNWEAKTSRVIKALQSPFALVLTGTPLENRLDDLYSVVEFIDDRRLGPAFRFFNRYRVTDERGRVLGYKNLDELRKKLSPVLLRRTRKMVLDELPPRVTEVMRIPPTGEQIELHNGHQRIIQTIIGKKYLTEMDMLRLQKALLMCRMAANSTFLVDKQPPGFSSKLKELDNLLAQLAAEEDRKTILFSEWTTMLNLIEPLLQKHNMDYVRLDGSVPQKKRQGLMHQFQNDPDCKVFISTNAGSTGLNLQAANTVVNVDLPWNPAVLEQRISRVHRMGQRRSVQVFILVTEDTLEESLLNTLAGKHELALAVLDPDAEVTHVDLSSGIEELKRRMEILLGSKPDAPPDESLKAQMEREAQMFGNKDRIASAGGQLFSAAFAFIGEMFSGKPDSEETQRLAGLFKEKLTEGIEKGADGQLRMTISFPDENALNGLAKTLARMAGFGN